MRQGAAGARPSFKLDINPSTAFAPPHCLTCCRTVSHATSLSHAAALSHVLPHYLTCCLTVLRVASLSHVLPQCLTCWLFHVLSCCLTCLPHCLPCCLTVSRAAALSYVLPHCLPCCLTVSRAASLSHMQPHCLTCCLTVSRVAVLSYALPGKRVVQRCRRGQSYGVEGAELRCRRGQSKRYICSAVMRIEMSCNNSFLQTTVCCSFKIHPSCCLVNVKTCPGGDHRKQCAVALLYTLLAVWSM